MDINTLTINSVLSTSTLSISYTVKPAVTVTLELTASLKTSQQDLHVTKCILIQISGHLTNNGRRHLQ